MKNEENFYYQKNSKLFLQLKDLYEKHPYSFLQKLNSKKYFETYNELKKWIYDVTSFKLLDIHTLITRIYWILNNIQDFPICPVCNKQDNYILKNVCTTIGYKETCCRECASKNPKRQNKIKNTCLERYGCENVYQNESIKEKCKQTKIDKFGVDHQMKCNNIKEKVANTKLKKYNDKNFNNREKAKNTCLERYGCENPHQNNEIKEKCKATCIQRYGTEYALQNPDVYQKLIDTNFERYGAKTVLSTEKIKNINRKKAYDKLFTSEYDIPISSFDEFCSSKELIFRCKKCGNEFVSFHINGIHHHCNKCYPILKSKEQNEIFDFIVKYFNNAVMNTHKIISPLELDIYVPEKKLAIEFDGLYWHSEKNDSNEEFNQNYHLMKTDLCEVKGIQLIHIFENEWIYQKDIVKSRIKNLLGIFDNTFFARKCIVKEIDSSTSMIFQDKNHIQGAINSKINLGLYFNDELISLMTFGKCRFDKKYEWEMLRFCNKLGYHIPGAAGKLLKYFERTYNPTSLISYADRRWSQGKLYKALGFELDHISKPNYWYFKSNTHILESRMKYQKHKLKNILKNFDESKTEVENMLNNGFYRIFDCGNLVFIKKYNQQ